MIPEKDTVMSRYESIETTIKPTHDVRGAWCVQGSFGARINLLPQEALV